MYPHAAESVAKTALRRWQPLSISLSARPFLTRLASTSSRHPFPFPLRTNPTPHEVFHLPHDASQDEIKTRYYELVRMYHPDAIHGHQDTLPSVRNAQFRAITHAYGVLRRRHGPSSNGGAGAWDYREQGDEAMRAELQRRYRRSRSTSTSTSTASDIARQGKADDVQFRYTLAAFVLAWMIVIMSSVSPHLDRVERHSRSAAAKLAEARAEAQIYGMERRKKIREHVRAFHDSREAMNRNGHPRMCENEFLPGKTMPRKRVE